MKRKFDDEKEYKTQFWENVDFLKEQNGETDEMLAQFLGLTLDSIRYSRSMKFCSVRTLVLLSNHYGKTVEEMIGKDLRFSAKS